MNNSKTLRLLRTSTIGALGLVLSLTIASSVAAPVVVKPGSVAGYVYIPAAVPASTGSGGSGSSTTVQNCYFQPQTDLTATFASLPAAMFPITIDYKMVGGGGGFSSWISNQTNGGGGGGGGSSAILRDGAAVAVAAGGNGADQGSGAGGNGTVAQGTLTINQGNTLRFIVGGGGGSVNSNEGVYSQSASSSFWNVAGGGGGAGYYGGGGGGGGYGNTAPYQAKGGKGGGSSGGAGGAAAASAQICYDTGYTYCWYGPGNPGTLSNGGNGSTGGSSIYGQGAQGLIGGSMQAGFYSGSGNYNYTAPAGSGGGFGAGGGVGFAQVSNVFGTSLNGSTAGGTNGSAAPFTLSIGASYAPVTTYSGWQSWGTNDFARTGISSLALNQSAGTGGDAAKRLAASPGQILVRYSAASCNLF